MPRCDRPAEPAAAELGRELEIPPSRAPEQDATDPSPPITVLIADAQALVRSGLARLLEEDERLRVVAVSEGGLGLVDICVATRIDVLVADVELHDLDILELIHLVSNKSPGTRILVLGSVANWRVSPVMAAGAAGFLVKDTAPEGLRSAVIAVHAGDQVLSRQAAVALMNGTALYRLTPREAAVLHHIARGSTNSEIAEAMHINEKTVRNYVSRLYRKLPSPSRAEMAQFAFPDSHQLPSLSASGVAYNSGERR